MLLDKTKDYSEVFGKTNNSCRYIQDGIQYCGDGTPAKNQNKAGSAALAAKKKEAEDALKAIAEAEKEAAEAAAKKAKAAEAAAKKTADK